MCLSKTWKRNWHGLNRSLSDGLNKPKPVRRVEIPKPGKDAGEHLSGVPCVRDRVVQATLKL